MVIRALLFLIVFFLAIRMDAPAAAYLDPGTGSMIIQAILGTIAAGITAIGFYWSKVKIFFTRRKSSGDEGQPKP